LFAAPKLRLTSSSLGPISVAAGSSGAAQTVEAYNAGDGTLALSAASSATWLSASVGSSRACSSRSGNCFPVQMSLNTGTLAAGSYTAMVTVSDPNAVDAPQTIVVIVQVGGGVPSSVNLDVAPGGTRDLQFSTNSQVNGVAKTQDGRNWLSLALEGGGSFRFSYPYRIRVAPTTDMGEGTYNGSLVISGSSFAGDNKTVPVAMRVTTQPIAQAVPGTVQIRLAQGAPPVTTGVALNNLGQGTLTLQTAKTSGESWITAAASGNAVALTLDPGSLQPGTYTSSLSFSTNAVNNVPAVPVEFDVVQKSAPLIRYQGVVDNGTFGAGDPVAPGDVTVILGEQLSYAPLAVGPPPPLAATVGGAQVLVNGLAVPMYYSSYGQLAFQMPVDIAPGTALVQVVRDTQTSNTVSVDVASRAPRLLRIGVGDYGAIVNASQGNSIPMPVGALPGVDTRPAHVGDVLTVYAIGLGPTSPTVATGQAAPSSEPFARLTETPTLNFGGSVGGGLAKPSFAALTPGYAGLYQVNVAVPQNSPKGTVNLTLVFSDAVSNAVQIEIQ
jgi:uncharacterized protein (TIGR03437 family)